MRLTQTLLVWAAAFAALSAWGLAQERLVVQGGTLIDVRDGSLQPNTTIVVEGDRIVQVGGSAPAGGTVIDARGKYILPGLIDLHAHYKGWAPELYLNHGVTTVIDLGNDHEWIKAQKEGILSGQIPGPRLFISTNNLDGPPPNPDTYFERPYVHIVDGPEDALKAMQQYQQEQVDAIKVYDGLSVPALRSLSREAQKAQIPLIGHFQNVRIAMDVNADGVEHLVAIANTILDEEQQREALQRVRPGYTPPAESFVDRSRIAGIAQEMVRSGLYLNPTLRMSWQGAKDLRDKGFPEEDFALTFNDWRLRYIPIQWKLANLKEYQEISLWHWQDLTQYERDIFERGYENAQRIVKAFSDAGGKFYAGTDCANMCVPGLGLHQELELIAAAGVPPLQVLQAATVNPAEIMRMHDRLGVIEEGKAGDVLILDANPLDDIRNTRKVHKVISRGRLLDGQYHADFRNPIPKNSFEDSSHFFPSPRIRWATPEAFIAGAASVTLTVHGSGFIPYSTVMLGGRGLKTEFVDRGQLKAEIPPELLTAGTYAVTVENPDFASGTIFAAGSNDISHMGVRPHISNEFLLMVKPAGGTSVFPHPRESPRPWE